MGRRLTTNANDIRRKFSFVKQVGSAQKCQGALRMVNMLKVL